MFNKGVVCKQKKVNKCKQKKLVIKFSIILLMFTV